MIIKPSSAYEVYKNNVSSVKNGASSASKADGKARVAGAPANTDKVTISSDASALAEVGRLASSISAEVSNLGNSERLAELGEQVRNGTYYVGTGILADAILGR